MNKERTFNDLRETVKFDHGSGNIAESIGLEISAHNEVIGPMGEALIEANNRKTSEDMELILAKATNLETLMIGMFKLGQAISLPSLK
jgi:hypothetical protein